MSTCCGRQDTCPFGIRGWAVMVNRAEINSRVSGSFTPHSEPSKPTSGDIQPSWTVRLGGMSTAWS